MLDFRYNTVQGMLCCTLTMKIRIIELGYYHPSVANWSYGVHLVIDDTGARLYRETFGGDSRARETLKKMGHEVEMLSAGQGTGVQYRWKDIKNLYDIENYRGINWGKGCLDAQKKGGPEA